MTPVTLLVVDDEADLEYVIRQKFKASIQAGEFSVVYAPHGEAALQQLARHPNIEVVLSDIRMPVPPLRERKDDLPLLIDHIMRRYPHRELSKDEFARLYAHSWPGNVRELWHVLERYGITGSLEFFDRSRDTLQPWLVDADTPAGTLADAVAALERHLLVQTLKRCHWHRGRTAAALGLPERTLRRKIKKYALSPPPTPATRVRSATLSGRMRSFP